MMQILDNKKNNISGQSTLEYILMATITIGITVSVLTTTENRLRRKFENFLGELESNLKTGRVDNSVWNDS